MHASTKPEDLPTMTPHQRKASAFEYLLNLDWKSFEAREIASHALHIHRLLANAPIGIEYKIGKALSAQAFAAMVSSPQSFSELHAQSRHPTALGLTDSGHSRCLPLYLGRLSSAQRKKIIAKGFLPWRVDHQSTYFDRRPDVATGTFKLKRNASLSDSYATLLCQSAIGSTALELDASNISALGEHLRLAKGGAQSAMDGFELAMAWMHKSPKQFSEKSLGKADHARLNKALSIGPLSDQQILDFKAKAKDAQEAAVKNALRLDDAQTWGTTASWAIRDDRLPVLEHLRLGAKAAGIDFATACFLPARDTRWEKKSSIERQSVDSDGHPARAETLFETSIKGKAERCAAALASLPGASSAFFDPNGNPISRNPFIALRDLVESSEPGQDWLARFTSISVAFASDLHARGCTRAASASAMESAAGKALREYGERGSVRKSNLERALMLQATELSEWARDEPTSLPTPTPPKAKARRL